MGSRTIAAPVCAARGTRGQPIRERGSECSVAPPECNSRAAHLTWAGRQCTVNGSRRQIAELNDLEPAAVEPLRTVPGVVL
jgi:hypothetical protein